MANVLQAGHLLGDVPFAFCLGRLSPSALAQARALHERYLHIHCVIFVAWGPDSLHLLLYAYSRRSELAYVQTKLVQKSLQQDGNQVDAFSEDCCDLTKEPQRY